MGSAAYEIEGTDEFEQWYGTLTAGQQRDVERVIAELEIDGPHLGRPYVDTVRESRHPRMKELRVQSGGRPLRIFFAFDPRRCAILLLGGDKTGDDRFYRRMIPIADRLFDQHLAHL